MKDKKNLIWILTDGLRADQLNCYNSNSPESKIDDFAKTGIRFTNAVSQGTFSPISFASFLTSLEPYHNGMTTIENKAHFTGDKWLNGKFDIARIRPKIKTIHQHLYELGYEVKTYSSLILGKNADYSYWGITGLNVEGAKDIVLKDLDQLLISDKPFFLFLRFSEISLCCLKNECVKYKELSYEDFIKEIIHIIHKDGEDTLKQMISEKMEKIIRNVVNPIVSMVQEKSDQTYCIVSSDHGNAFGSRLKIDELTINNTAHTYNLYEPTIRVPLIMNGPDIPQNKVITRQVRLMDVIPTILSYMNLPPLDHPCGIKSDGVDLSSLINQDKSIDIPNAFSNSADEISLRNGEFKYIQNFKTGDISLYDIENDPNEYFDLAKIHKKIVFDFQNELSIRIEKKELKSDDFLKFNVNKKKIEKELKYLGYK